MPSFDEGAEGESNKDNDIECRGFMHKTEPSGILPEHQRSHLPNHHPRNNQREIAKHFGCQEFVVIRRPGPFHDCGEYPYYNDACEDHREPCNNGNRHYQQECADP